MIYTRNDLTQLLSNNSTGCELGVFEGEFSTILHASKKFDKLYLVDTFSGEASNFGTVYQDASILEKRVRDKFIEDKNVYIYKLDSINFLRSMPDVFFDFIYIDTVHSYDTTMLELEESYRCTKDSGFICGHDYTEKFFPGVVQAVKQFCRLYNLRILVTQQIEDYPSFIIRKT